MGAQVVDRSLQIEAQVGRSRPLASEYGLAYWAAIASVQRGWARAGFGPESEAVELLQGGMRSYCDMGAGTHEVAYRALAVQGYARTGRLDDAHHELADAYDGLARHGDRYLESELHRLRGELLLRRDWGGATGSGQERAEAERQFRSAIDVARRQQARSLEPPCRDQPEPSPARSRATRGGPGRALRRGRVVHEGFDVPDLEDAAALLHVDAPPAAPVA